MLVYTQRTHAHVPRKALVTENIVTTQSGWCGDVVNFVQQFVPSDPVRMKRKDIRRMYT